MVPSAVDAHFDFKDVEFAVAGCPAGKIVAPHRPSHTPAVGEPWVGVID